MDRWKDFRGFQPTSSSCASSFNSQSIGTCPSCRKTGCSTASCVSGRQLLSQSHLDASRDRHRTFRLPVINLSTPLLLFLSLITQLLPQPATCQTSLISVLTFSCYSSTASNGSVQCTTTLPPQALNPNSFYLLTAGVAATDFSRPGQTLSSLTINGVDLLQGVVGCVPFGVCSSSPPSFSTCFHGDVTKFLSSSQPSSLVARASPAVTSPCSACGSSTQLPCSVLILQYQLQVLLRVSAPLPPPLAPSSPSAPSVSSSPPPPPLKLGSTPPSISTSTSGTFEWGGPGCASCSYTCQVDSSPPVPCRGTSYNTGNLPDGVHTFNLTATSAASSLPSSVSYTWTIDSQGPVATLSVTPPQTGSAPVLLTLTYSKPCATATGLLCSNSSCQLALSPALSVDPSTFQTLSPGLSYSVSLHVTALVSTIASVRLAGSVCRDKNGVQGIGSSAVVVIDLLPPVPTVSCQVASQPTTFFSQPREVLSTNRSPVLCQVSFSKPIVGVNLSLLQVVNGTASNITLLSDNTTLTANLQPAAGGGPLSLTLLAGATADAAGNVNAASEPFNFFFDQSPLSATLVGPNDADPLASLYPVLLSFSHPVPNLSPTSLTVTNGVVTCLSSADSGLGRFYSITLAPLTSTSIQVALPGGSVTDYAGNPNSASNTLHIRHQSSPPRETIPGSIVAGVFGWTAVVTGSVSLAMAVRESDPSASPGIRIVSNRPFRAVSTPVVGADPARNLLRMAFHLQVFALSEHLAVGTLPLFYREVLKGMRFLYYYLPMPYEERMFRGGGTPHPLTLFPTQAPGVNSTGDQQVCALAYYYNMSGLPVPSPPPPPSPAARKLFSFSPPLPDSPPAHLPRQVPPPPSQTEWGQRRQLQTLSPPLTVPEYFYSQQWGDAFTINFPNLSPSFHGFREYLRILLYSVAVLLLFPLLQTAAQLTCFALQRKWLYGLLDPPRLHFFLLASSLSGVTWGSTLLILASRQPGGHVAGFVVGVLTLYLWPFALVMAAVVVVWLVVVQEQFARFFVREMTEPRAASCLPSLARAFWMGVGQKRLKGHWVTITPAERHILPRLGMFFEDYTVWGTGGFFGVLKDRLRALYSAVEFCRMICVAVLFAVWRESDDSVVQPILLLCATLVLFLYLVILQPFTERGIQVVEGFSLLCEAAIFSCAVLVKEGGGAMTESRANTLAIVMLAFGCAAFVGQLMNHWAALAQQLSRLFYPSDDDERTPTEESESEVYTDDDVMDEDNDRIERQQERGEDLEEDEGR